MVSSSTILTMAGRRFLSGAGFLAIALHLEDVVLPGDLALRKVIQRAYGLDHLPSQAEVVATAEAWRPHRSLAVNYLFAPVYGE
jgi:DNA-3-methyladenine glycosylase II